MWLGIINAGSRIARRFRRDPRRLPSPTPGQLTPPLCPESKAKSWYGKPLNMLPGSGLVRPAVKPKAGMVNRSMCSQAPGWSGRPGAGQLRCLPHFEFGVNSEIKLGCRLPSVGLRAKQLAGYKTRTAVAIILFYFIHFIFLHIHILASFWTSRDHRCRPFSPPALGFEFLSRIRRVQQSRCSSIFDRVMLTHAFALSASRFVHKRKYLRIYTSTHSAGLELTKLISTRPEDNTDTPPGRPALDTW